MLLVAPAAHAIDYDVNVHGDIYDSLTPCTGADAGDCSLREAILAANASPTTDVINLPEGPYPLTRPGANEDAAEFGDLDIVDNGDITIQGASGRTTTINADAINERAIEVFGSLNIVIDGVRITGGGPVAQGGGIRLDGNGGSFTALIRDSAVIGNTADLGGGIYAAEGGVLNLIGTTVSGNSADVRGGGIFKEHAGAITDLSLLISTVSNNTQSDSQPLLPTDYGGGGIANAEGALNLGDVTIANNHAESGGGGVQMSAGSANVFNSIVSENTAPDATKANCDNPLSSGGGNVERGTTCSLATGTDVNGDPMLGPLTNNGGPTNTHFPAAGGAAIGAAVSGLCSGPDQRGVSRPKGAECESGAVEAEPTDVSIAMSDSPDPAEIEERLVYTITVKNEGDDPARRVTVTDTLPTTLRPRTAFASQGSCTGDRTKVCALGAIAPGETATVDIGSLPKTLGPVTNTATVAMANPSLDSTNDSATTTTTVGLRSGPCANRQPGTDGSDTLTGTSAGDRLRGFDGNDVLRGFAGADCLIGDRGKDKLNGGNGKDKLVAGPGDDTLKGGQSKDSYDAGKGDDRISAADGKGEIVRCGKGFDRATVDDDDIVRGCEAVTRKSVALRF